MKEHCDKHGEFEAPPQFDLGCPECFREALLQNSRGFTADEAKVYSQYVGELFEGDQQNYCQKHGRYIPAGVLRECPECLAEVKR